MNKGVLKSGYHAKDFQNSRMVQGLARKLTSQEHHYTVWSLVIQLLELLKSQLDVLVNESDLCAAQIK